MDVNEAIQALEEAVRLSLEAAKADGAKAFEAGQFERAKQAADEGKTIEAFVEEVTRLSPRKPVERLKRPFIREGVLLQEIR